MTKRPDILERLIKAFLSLPGVGPKAAERIAFHLVRQSPAHLQAFAQVVAAIPKSIVRCAVCGTFDSKSPCGICTDPKRETATVCVVAQPMDIRAIESTHEFHGRYHVLHGLLNPLEGVTPTDLSIGPLLKRLADRRQPVREIILALNPTVEGEATALYIQKTLRRPGLRITKIARGLPLGAELDYADEMTLADSLRGRREY